MTRSLTAVVVLVVALGVFAVLDPLHLRHAAPAAAVLVALGVVLATWLVLRLTRRRAVRVTAVVVGGLTLLGWAGFGWLVVSFTGPQRVVEQVPGDGARLVVVEASAFEDTVYSVRLRAGDGPFGQESLVWQGLAEGAPPIAVRFPEAGQVEVLAAGGCGYRAGYDPTTLAVEPVFRPLRLDGC